MDEFYPDKVIHMFRYDVRGELGDCWKALSDGNAAAMEGENHRAYELYKKAICGTGNSEYTRIFTDYVNISIEAYCTCKNLTPLTTNQFGAREIQRFAGLHRFDDIGFVLVSMADAESNLINAEALRKEALFWLRLDEDNPDVPNEIARLQGSLSKGRE
jgi:hypothetical protein